MAEAERGKTKKFAYLDQLSTEKLEELLRADFESPESSNDGVIFNILEVIEKREKEHPTGRLPDVDKSWEDFQKYYNIPEGEGSSLYPNEGQNDLMPAISKPIPLNAIKKHRHLRRVLVSVAAAICVVVFLVPPALGYDNIFQMIGQWTTEQFNFSETSDTQNNNSETKENQSVDGYDSLEDAIAQYGIYDKVVPKSIPAGFQLQEIWIQQYSESGNVEFSAPYENGDDNIVITIIQHSGKFEKNYEKNGQVVEEYLSGNIKYYIFQNNNNNTAAWYVDSLECSISTTLSIAELEKIIDSIYEE